MSCSTLALLKCCQSAIMPPLQSFFCCVSQPLADGASNPSLHEHSKLTAVPNDESSSASDGESLSQEQDNDDSSHFISSSHVPKSLQNQSFTRVSNYPSTLTQPGWDQLTFWCENLRLALTLVKNDRWLSWQVPRQDQPVLFSPGRCPKTLLTTSGGKIYGQLIFFKCCSTV